MNPLPAPSGLLEREALAAEAANVRRDGRRVVFTNGCFDLVHPGHVLYLEAARALGDRLVVGINSDASVTRLKGPHRPILPAVARATVLLGLRAVDWVTVFDEDTPLELISALRPDVLVKGGDYALDQIVGRREVESWGGIVKVIPFVPGFSTSELERRLRQL